MENLESLGGKLVRPSVTYKKSFLEAVREFQAEGAERYTKIDIAETEKDFEGFLSKIVNREKGVDLPEGRVPESQLWLVDGGEFIGAVYLRHRLNEALLQKGGHIGYFIRPTKRRMRYGTKALGLALPIAKSLGIDKVLITCDDDNEGSYRIIEKNGGVLENTINYQGGLKRRYWIENK